MTRNAGGCKDVKRSRLPRGRHARRQRGRNGFFRSFKGSVATVSNANVVIGGGPDGEGCAMSLDITNRAANGVHVHIHNVTTGATVDQILAAGQSVTRYMPFVRLFGWYDLVVTADNDASFRQHLAGHIENGRDSISDPAIGAF